MAKKLLIINELVINVDVNVGVNDVEKVILEELVKNSQLTANDFSIIISKSKRTAERYLKHLQEKGYLERSASDKTGNWAVVKLCKTRSQFLANKS
jgi:predicted transcriptional regulator